MVLQEPGGEFLLCSILLYMSFFHKICYDQESHRSACVWEVKSLISVLQLFPQNEMSTVIFKGIILINVFQYCDNTTDTRLQFLW